MCVYSFLSNVKSMLYIDDTTNSIEWSVLYIPCVVHIWFEFREWWKYDRHIEGLNLETNRVKSTLEIWVNDRTNGVWCGRWWLLREVEMFVRLSSPLVVPRPYFSCALVHLVFWNSPLGVGIPCRRNMSTSGVPFANFPLGELFKAMLQLHLRLANSALTSSGVLVIFVVGLFVGLFPRLCGRRTVRTRAYINNLMLARVELGCLKLCWSRKLLAVRVSRAIVKTLIFSF